MLKFVQLISLVSQKRKQKMSRKHIVGFGGFKPKYNGSVNEDPLIRSILENKTVEEILKESEAAKK